MVEQVLVKSRPAARKVVAEKAALPLGQILPGDCIEAMRSLPDASVDLVFADPPYNLQLGGDLNRPDGSHVDAVTDDWDQFDSFAAYDEFTRDWLTEARRVLKPDGSLWVIGSYHNIFRVGAILQDLGFWILNDIVWRKSNPMPNFRGTRFTNAHETLIWASQGEKAKYHFNYRAMKTLNDELQMRSDWVIPDLRRAGAAQEGRHKGPPDAEARSAALPRDAGDDRARAMSCSIRSSAPAPPARSPSGWAANGSAASARRLIREAALERIEMALPLDESALKTMQSRKDAPRVAFGALVEAGLIAAGHRAVRQEAPLFRHGARRWLAGARARKSARSIGRQEPARRA